MDPPSIPPTINSFPVEIFGEIFSHCLPDFPLNEAQPNVGIAPMLLCRVCSLWRTIALANPGLWSHLYVRLPIQTTAAGEPALWDSKALSTIVEFMERWRDNQGSVAPFIRIQLNQENAVDARGRQTLTNDLITSFSRCLSSAQFIDISNGLLSLVLRDDRTERRFHDFGPNLHTLLVHCGQRVDSGHIPTVITTPLKIPIPSTLRRLSISYGAIRAYVDWSGLTQLLLESVNMRPNVWLHLIRGLLNLQWGHFRIFDLSGSLIDNNFEYYAPMVTLPRLKTLTLSVNIPFKKYALGDTPVLYFMNLHLPALRDLSIQSVIFTERNFHAHCIITEIKNLLRSAPGIIKLALSPVLCFNYPHASEEHLACSEIEPLLMLAPNLSHLQLDIPYEIDNWDNEASMLESFTWWCKSFSFMHWIDLENPQIAVQKITIVVKTVGQNTSMAEAVFGDKLTSFIEEYKQKSQAEFEIIWEEREGGLQSMDTRKMWS